MKAVQVVGYHTKLQLTDIPEPKIDGPLDVIVRIGGAGVCRTDIHILEGQWAEKSGVALPYTIGHENAGWVHSVGDAVTNVTVGDKVILHPLITCGLCRACRFGDDVHCENNQFPGIDTNGGYAEYLRTTARSVVKIDDSLEPAEGRRARGRGPDCVPRGGEGGADHPAGKCVRGDRCWRSWSHRNPSAEGDLGCHRGRRRPQSAGGPVGCRGRCRPGHRRRRKPRTAGPRSDRWAWRRGRARLRRRGRSDQRGCCHASARR